MNLVHGRDDLLNLRTISERRMPSNELPTPPWTTDLF